MATATTATASADNKIILKFAWQGTNRWNGGIPDGGLDVRVVDLIFKNAKTEISVNLPEDINPSQPRKFSFTCRKYHENSGLLAKETFPDKLSVTGEQVRNLTIKVGYFEQGPLSKTRMMDRSGKITQDYTVHRSNRKLTLDLAEGLEIGQTYTLIISAGDNAAVTARLVKEEVKVQAEQDEFKSRLAKMGVALFAEGVRNLAAASTNPPLAAEDAYANCIKGVVRAGQEVHPGFVEPEVTPSESPSDLDRLTLEDLQSRFEKTFIKDKQFESERMKAALAGNISEVNRITQVELANSRLLINLSEAIERKGAKAQIPQSESFRSVAHDSAELHEDALNKLAEKCGVQ